MRSGKLVIKMVPCNLVRNVVFRIEVHKFTSSRVSFLLERIGFYNTDPSNKSFFINSSRLGFWLNRGAVLRKSLIKVLHKFLVSKKKVL